MRRSSGLPGERGGPAQPDRSKAGQGKAGTAGQGRADRDAHRAATAQEARETRLPSPSASAWLVTSPSASAWLVTTPWAGEWLVTTPTREGRVRTAAAAATPRPRLAGYPPLALPAEERWR